MNNSISSRTSSYKICKLCNEEKPHYTQGFYCTPVCHDCMKTLPPVPRGMKRCCKCLEVKDRSDFSHGQCKDCWNTYTRENYDAEKKRNENLKSNYGITLEEYEMLFLQQAGLCAICKNPEQVVDPYTKKPKFLAVDHCHSTGFVRALLCHRCNVLLGLFEQDPYLFKQLRKYHNKYL